MNNRRKSVHYQVRVAGCDGADSWFLVDPANEDHEYNPFNRRSSVSAARHFGGWVVQVTQELVFSTKP